MPLHVVVRMIGPDTPPDFPPGYPAADVAANDTIVLLSGSCVAVGETAYAAAAHANPAALAERLAEEAFADTAVPYAAIAVFQLEA